MLKEHQKEISSSHLSRDLLQHGESKTVFTVLEYRKTFNDYVTNDKCIEERIEYVTNFTRKIIRLEIDKHVDDKQLL